MECYENKFRCLTGRKKAQVGGVSCFQLSSTAAMYYLVFGELYRETEHYKCWLRLLN